MIMKTKTQNKIENYLLKATSAPSEQDLITALKTIQDTKKFIAELEADIKDEMIRYDIAYYKISKYKPMPKKEVLEAKFGNAFLKLFKTKTRKIFTLR
tara:strand:- start:767 stop:1060 length:294 start_codon:yes stop_codon:yes gene_type:complete